MTADLRDALKAAAAQPRRRFDTSAAFQVGRRRRRHKTMTYVGACGLVAIALVAGAVTQLRTPDIVLGGGDGPAVQVMVQGAEGFSVTVGPLRSSPRGGWRHDMTISNDSGGTLYVDDPRISGFVGDRELLVGAGGCGYGTGSERGVEPACLLDYRPLTINSGDRWTTRLQLWHGLAGMSEPRQRRYEFRTPLSYRFTEPFTGEGNLPRQSAHITLVYSLGEAVSDEFSEGMSHD